MRSQNEFDCLHMEIHAICSARNREDQTVGGLIQNCGVGMWTV